MSSCRPPRSVRRSFQPPAVETAQMLRNSAPPRIAEAERYDHSQTPVYPLEADAWVGFRRRCNTAGDIAHGLDWYSGLSHGRC
jgi:hypothetical protein